MEIFRHGIELVTVRIIGSYVIWANFLQNFVVIPDNGKDFFLIDVWRNLGLLTFLLIKSVPTGIVTIYLV